MDEHLNNRFEFLREKIHELDSVPLDPSRTVVAGNRGNLANRAAFVPALAEGQGIPAQAECKDSASHVGSSEDLPNFALSWRFTAHPQSPAAVNADGLIQRIAEPAERDSECSSAAFDWHRFEGAIVQPLREELAKIAEETVRTTGTRLKRMVDETLLGFTSEAERSLQRCTGIALSRAIQLMEAEVEFAVQRSVRAGLAHLESDLRGATTKRIPVVHESRVNLNDGPARRTQGIACEKRFTRPVTVSDTPLSSASVESTTKRHRIFRWLAPWSSWRGRKRRDDQPAWRILGLS